MGNSNTPTLFSRSRLHRGNNFWFKEEASETWITGHLNGEMI